MLSYVLILSGVTEKLLIMSGVEINPGPFSLGKKFLIFILTFVEIHLIHFYTVMKKIHLSRIILTDKIASNKEINFWRDLCRH